MQNNILITAVNIIVQKFDFILHDSTLRGPTQNRIARTKDRARSTTRKMSKITAPLSFLIVVRY